jgi:hypothetical protein
MIKYIKKQIDNFKKNLEIGITENNQRKCKHEHWNCDTQIRTIECKSCGLRAWIDDYVNLYDK